VKVMERRLRAKDSIISAELENEAVLLNVETGIYFGVDAVGTRIWKLLEEGSTEEDIFSKLQQEYEVDPTVLRADLTEFLDLLQSNELVQVIDG
jgi:hypothetical protein